jgi:hypothetical protein
MESQEKHTLLFFEPEDCQGVVLRAHRWASQRDERLDNFQMLIRLSGNMRYEALFNPEEGNTIFAY